MGERKGGNKDGDRTVLVSIEGDAGTLTAECQAADTIAEMLESLARAHGRPDLLEFAVSVEDADDQLVAATAVDEALRGNRRGRVHLHRCRRVKVALEFNANSKTREFSPATTVHRVLMWAVGPHGFNVESDVHDLVLQVSGTTDALAPNVHVGALLRGGSCDLSLELVPKDRPQG